MYKNLLHIFYPQIKNNKEIIFYTLRIKYVAVSDDQHTSVSQNSYK